MSDFNRTVPEKKKKKTLDKGSLQVKWQIFVIELCCGSEFESQKQPLNKTEWEDAPTFCPLLSGSLILSNYQEYSWCCLICKLFTLSISVCWGQNLCLLLVWCSAHGLGESGHLVRLIEEPCDTGRKNPHLGGWGEQPQDRGVWAEGYLKDWESQQWKGHRVTSEPKCTYLPGWARKSGLTWTDHTLCARNHLSSL